MSEDEKPTETGGGEGDRADRFCPHVMRRDLEPFSVLDHSTTHGWDDGTRVFRTRMHLCAFCAGQVQGALGLLLSTGCIHHGMKPCS
jgi:hypothetical protein